MTKNVQHPRGSTTAEDAITGLAGQIRVDTTRNELRLHDGTTPGGHRILTSANVSQLIDDLIQDVEINVKADITYVSSKAAMAALEPGVGMLVVLNQDEFAQAYVWVDDYATYPYDGLKGHVASTHTPGSYYRPLVQTGPAYDATEALDVGADLTLAEAADPPVGITLPFYRLTATSGVTNTELFPSERTVDDFSWMQGLWRPFEVPSDAGTGDTYLYAVQTDPGGAIIHGVDNGGLTEKINSSQYVRCNGVWRWTGWILAPAAAAEDMNVMGAFYERLG